MNYLLNIVNNWLICNKLSLNLKKTVYITFGLHCDSVPVSLDITIEDTKLNKVEHCKYLGIIIDQNLRWDKHVEFLINKTKYLIFLFYKLSKIMQTDTLLMIYYAFFHSILCHGILAWGGVYFNKLALLQNVQNRLLKIVNKNTFAKKLPMSIKQIFACESLLYFYNINKQKFICNNSCTRNKLIQLPKIHKSALKKSSAIKAINTYNELPKEYKTLDVTKNLIKSKLKDWIKNNILM